MIGFYNAVVEFFRSGGLFMYPIGIILAIGLAIILERWLFLGRQKKINRNEFEGFLTLLRKGDLNQMRVFTRESAANLLKIIGCGLDMVRVTRKRADVESAMHEAMLEVIPRLQARTNQLAMLANTATLLGLLGTIIGLISAFTAVANVDPSEKLTMLSSAISVAMNTTAFGLIAAIPLLMFHSILRSKTDMLITSIDGSASKFLNVMTIHGLVRTEENAELTSDINPDVKKELIDKTLSENRFEYPQRLILRGNND